MSISEVLHGTELLIASVSAYERRRLEELFAKAGAECRPLGVEDAFEAERRWSAAGRRPVLVIDAGLLRAARDAQWRALRGRQPMLAAVVRCLVPEVRRSDDRTFLVPPDDDTGILEAVRVLQKGPVSTIPHAAQPRRIRATAAIARKTSDPE